MKNNLIHLKNKILWEIFRFTREGNRRQGRQNINQEMIATFKSLDIFVESNEQETGVEIKRSTQKQ